MKNDLICQTTNYDCGPTTVTNAMRFLFEREEIPPVVLKSIWTMGIDTYADGGELGKAGTSKAAMRYMAAWFECFAEKCGFPVKAAFLDSDFAALYRGSLTWKCLERGGCAVVRCWHGNSGHYVLLTELLPDGMIGLFDPYDGEADESDPDRRPVYDDPKRKNRVVRAEILNQTEKINYAMGDPNLREVLLFWRPDR